MSPYPTIDGLEFTAMVGRGGMATIYAARQLGLNRDVAVKVVEVSGSDAAQYMQRLENEAQSLAQLRHPGIVGLYQFGRTNEGAMYYVMPLLDGGDLSQQQRPMSEDRVVALLDQLLDALDHAHRAGIVHRDIKPENILFDADGRPLLADFGAAQRASPSRLTEAGMAIGSAGYMSPEQARGQVVDARSDLYSVGVLAYELLTGRLPFEGSDALSIALAQVEQKPAPLPQGRQQWQRFFDRALALEPGHRFGSAAEMRSALGEMHTRQTPRHPLPPAARRTRALALVVAAILLIAGYAGIVYWREQARSEQRLMIAELIENGQLDGPVEPNALAALAALNGDHDETIQQLRDRLLELLWDGLEPALMKRDWVALSTPLRRWSDAVTMLEAHSRGLVVAQQEQLTQQLRPSMAQALQRFDRAGADALLILLDDWQPLPPDLRDLVTQLRQIPAVGEALPDDAGPPLLLIRPPESDRPGLAIMAAALDPQWYGRFLADTGKTERECASPDPKVRGCVSVGEARQLADWLSQQSGQRYRLPTREEITEAAGYIAASPTMAWTDSCQQVTHTTRPNAAKRARGGIKQVFGGQGAKPTVERRCDGNWLMQLDGSGQLVARNNPTPAATVVLLREITTAGDRPEHP